jgi:hypothetical protein
VTIFFACSRQLWQIETGDRSNERPTVNSIAPHGSLGINIAISLEGLFFNNCNRIVAGCMY